jgi:hypothetical protein
MSWFCDLFGFEESVESVQANLTCQFNGTTNIMQSKANGRSFNAGVFRTASPSSYSNLQRRGGGKFHVVEGRGLTVNGTLTADILKLQSFPENNGATFQAASNFNCIEILDQSETAALGVTRYENDISQGPYCAIACAPAAVFRHYFVCVRPGVYGQLVEPINLLQRTPFRVENGYPIIDKNDIAQFQANSHDFSDPEQYLTGSHTNCQVTCTREDGGEWIVPFNGDQMVHHVYAAAFDYDYNQLVVRSPETYEMSRHLLYSEYRTTILAAWDHSIRFPGLPGSSKLYLTNIGGGFFGVPQDIITDAIVKNRDVIEDSGLNVYLVQYRANDPTGGQLRDLVDQTGGSVLNV